MSRSTFKILFYANKGKEKDGIVPIMGRITINGTQCQFSCKHSIPLAMWDVKGNCAKGRSKESLQINCDLDNIKAQIIKHYQHLSDREAFVTAVMTKIAREYMELMGIKDTQFLLVRHFENGNPHCHLVYNRVNNEGKTISDQNDFRRNEQVTKQLKRKYGLSFSKGKAHTKTERLRGTEKTKYEIYHAIGTGLQRCKSWQGLVNYLKVNGVEMELVMKRNGSKDLKDLQGMRFTKDGYTFKASQIRRGLSFEGIMSKLNSNAEKEQQRTINRQTHSRQMEQSRQEICSERQEHNELSIGIPSLGLFDTSNPVYDPAEEEFRRRMQHKKKKRGPRL